MGKKEKAALTPAELQSKKNLRKVKLAWPTLSISTSVAASLFGFATFYATDVMGLSAVAVGLIFMVSKIFDGFTDIVAGVLIDKTHTRLGKGRPWQFAIWQGQTGMDDDSNCDGHSIYIAWPCQGSGG